MSEYFSAGFAVLALYSTLERQQLFGICNRLTGFKPAETRPTRMSEVLAKLGRGEVSDGLSMHFWSH